MTVATFSLPQCQSKLVFAKANLYCTFNPFTELMQRVHRAGLAQLNLGLGTLQGSGCAESLFQSQHYLINLQEETKSRSIKVCFHGNTLKAQQQCETLLMLTKY